MLEDLDLHSIADEQARELVRRLLNLLEDGKIIEGAPDSAETIESRAKRRSARDRLLARRLLPRASLQRTPEHGEAVATPPLTVFAATVGPMWSRWWVRAMMMVGRYSYRSATCGRSCEDGVHHPDGTSGGVRCNGQGDAVSGLR